MAILKVEHLSQRFGSKQILDNICFSVPEKAIFGFLGQNGAGKTTTMKIILGLMKPVSGEVSISGERVIYGQTATNQFVGYLPDVPEFYPFMKPREYLTLCAHITQMPSSMIKKRVDDMIERVGLSKVDKRIAGFSRGMKQRLGIAQALLNAPKLLICDEPTSALDPIGRQEILEILYQAKEETTVIFSTHILSDVERICDHIAVLDKGKIVLQGAIQDIKSKRRQEKLTLEFKERIKLQKFQSLPEFKAMADDATEVGHGLMIKSTDLNTTLSSLMEIFLEHDMMPSKIEVLEPTVEDLFMEVVE